MTPTTATTATRQPVQARSLATRTALLDAALEALSADGYAAVTTTDIAQRAGVSRGAQLYHFPTKAQLLTAAIEHLLARRLAEFRATVTAVAARSDLLDASIDLLWDLFQGPAFTTWVELWIAARTDPDLAATMIDLDERFTDESRQMFVELVPGADAFEPRAAEMVRDFAFAVMSGMALQRLVPRRHRPADDYLDLLKQMAHTHLTDARP